jgi:hypothetical protein
LADLREKDACLRKNTTVLIRTTSKQKRAAKARFYFGRGGGI